MVITGYVNWLLSLSWLRVVIALSSVKPMYGQYCIAKVLINVVIFLPEHGVQQ